MAKDDEPRTPSALRNPVGPADRSVYMRRRLIVLLGFLALVAAIVLIVVQPGSTERPSSSQEVEVPDDLVETPAADAEGEEETPACEPTNLEVTPVADQASYGPGETPELSLTVENTGDAACIADLGTAGMTFSVASGSDEVWKSVDCQTSSDSLPVILEAGEVLESETVTWDRTRSSSETCDITRDPVVAGGASYHLSVTAGGAESRSTAQFLLY